MRDAPIEKQIARAARRAASSLRRACLNDAKMPRLTLRDLRKMAKVRGIVDVRFGIPLAGDGKVRQVGDDLVVELSRTIRDPRARFTLAHEIGHTYLRGDGARRLPEGLAANHRAREMFCDRFASHLLFPDDHFPQLSMLRHLRFPNGLLAAVDSLSQRFGISREMLLTKAHRLSAWPESIRGLVFKKMPHPRSGGPPKLRVAWTFQRKPNEWFVPRFKTLPGLGFAGVAEVWDAWERNQQRPGIWGYLDANRRIGRLGEQRVAPYSVTEDAVLSRATDRWRPWEVRVAVTYALFASPHSAYCIGLWRAEDVETLRPARRGIAPT